MLLLPSGIGRHQCGQRCLRWKFFLQAPDFGQMLCIFGQNVLYLDASEKEQWRAPPSQKSTVFGGASVCRGCCHCLAVTVPERRKGFIFPSKREFETKS